MTTTGAPAECRPLEHRPPRRILRIARLVLLLAILASAVYAGVTHGVAARAGRDTALDLYVRAPDPVYAYRPINLLEGSGYRAHILEMTSQTWRTPDEVDRTVWKHWLTIIVPETVRHGTALLYISGGRSTTPAPMEADPFLARVAVATGSVTVLLQQVPNQPLTFPGEGQPRREDALIAYAWDRFLRTGDPTWVPRLPMTKSAVRAMDTVIDFCALPEAGRHAIESFVVAGSSKRGWTTWTTAAVDSRVVAIVPRVIDLLNVEPSFRHHYRTYGFWSTAIQEFIDMDIPQRIGTREFRALTRIEDPYSYRARLTLPKFIVNAAGDPFFVPDSSRFYFADLPGEKHLRYIPNADHSLDGTDADDSLLAFYRAIVGSVPRPEFTWRFEGRGSIRVRTNPSRPAFVVRLWQASNAEARDFRLATIGASWVSRVLEPRGKGIYVGSVSRPARGWTAFMIEMTYPGSGDEPFKFTTAVRVIPETLPFRSPRTGAPGRSEKRN